MIHTGSFFYVRMAKKPRFFVNSHIFLFQEGVLTSEHIRKNPYFPLSFSIVARGLPSSRNACRGELRHQEW